MKLKVVLYIGILLLVVGLIFRYLTPYTSAGLSLVIIGVILKLSYILQTMRSGQYKPQAEIYLLLSGLLLLFLGLWHKLNVSEVVGYSMISAALVLKLLFLILFVRKTRFNKANVNS
jgi:uncharacterized membrane protein HdeD (DUF308 family)